VRSLRTRVPGSNGPACPAAMGSSLRPALWRGRAPWPYPRGTAEGSFGCGLGPCYTCPPAQICTLCSPGASGWAPSMGRAAGRRRRRRRGAPRCKRGCGGAGGHIARRKARVHASRQRGRGCAPGAQARDHLNPMRRGCKGVPRDPQDPLSYEP
jgi:hypothetical protein